MTDVAALAGVSHQTVSRVINNIGSVSADTRERVLAAIEQLGYQRNESARALATRRSNLIGIITTTDISWGPAQTVFGVEMAAKDAGYLVSIAALSDFSEQTLRDTINVFASLGVAGIVLIAPVEEVARDLSNLSVHVPLVTISSAWIGEGTDVGQVGINQRSGATRAVEHLIGAGARSIAHIAGPKNWFDASEREHAWRDAVAAAGLPDGTLLRGDWTAASGYAMARQLLAQEVPDAIFCSNDQMALGALHALTEASISVPGDVMLVGFDDQPGTEFFTPGLTTVAQDFAALGRAALESIKGILQGGPVGKTLIEPELVVRDST